MQNWSNRHVRNLLTGQVLHTFNAESQHHQFVSMLPVPGQPELLVAGDKKGHVHLWDIRRGEF
jgi:hypothetical protein